LDKENNIVVWGKVRDSVDFDPGPATFMMGNYPYSCVFNLKLDSAGNFIWAKQINVQSMTSDRGIDAHDRNAIVTLGQFTGKVDFDPGADTFYITNPQGSASLFVLNLDSMGNFSWVDIITGDDNLMARNLHIDHSRNILVAGNLAGTADFDPGIGIFNLTNSGNMESFVVKYNPFGALVWAKKLNGSSTNGISNVVTDLNGFVYLTGYFQDTVDCDPGPGVFNLISSGQGNVYVVKLDANGNFVWAKGFLGVMNANGCGLAADNIGQIYISGNFKGSGDFNPGNGVFTLLAPFSINTFIVCLQENGNFIWALKLGDTNLVYGDYLSLDAAFNLYLQGEFLGKLDLNPGSGSFLFTNIGPRDEYFLKLNQGSLGISEKDGNETIRVYPNPCTGILCISSLKPLQDATFKIYNCLGALVVNGSFTTSEVSTIDLSKHPAGLYFIKIQVEGQDSFMEKVIKL